MVDDIRNVDPDAHWDQFQDAWTALLTYRYLGKESVGVDAGVEIDTMPLRHDMRNAVGGINAAPLAIASPEPHWLDDAVVPAPVVMSYDVIDPARDVSRVHVLRDVIHLGRTMGFSRSRVVDADDHDRVIAISTGCGVSLGVVPGGFDAVDNPPLPVVDAPDLPSLSEVFGVIRQADGTWQLPLLDPTLSSPHAALHIGPINVALDTVAIEVAEAVAGGPAQVESWTVVMVRPGTTGPFTASATHVGGVERIAVEATLRDDGREGRIIATANAVFRSAR